MLPITVMAKMIISNTTFSFLLLFLFGLGIFLLPLQNNALNSMLSISRLWNDFGWFFLCVLLIFYVLNGEHIFSKTSRFLVHLSLFLCSLILIASIPLTLFQLPQTILLLTSVISIPFISYLCSKFGSNVVILVLLAVITLHSQWAIIHSVLQEDIGLQLLGESNISRDIAGVAKFQSAFNKVIRSYGPYPHPNILANSCLVGLILLTLFIKDKRDVITEYLLTLLPISGIILIALITTFSRSAYIGMFVILGIGCLYARNDTSFILRIKPFLITTLLLLISFSPLILFRVTDREDKALTERASGISWALDIIEDTKGHGVGVGNYMLYLDTYLAQQNIEHSPWEVSPVHSVPLLIAAEAGILMTLLLLGTLLVCIYKVPTLLLLTPLVPLLLTDHNIYTSTSSLILTLSTASILSFRQYRNTSQEHI